MTPQLTADDVEAVFACPECDRAGQVWERTHPYRDYDNPYHCQSCGAEFDEANRRPPNDDKCGITDDGIPAGMNKEMREMIREKRDG